MGGYQPARDDTRADQDVSSFYQPQSGPPSSDLTELRRQQAAFQAERTRFDDKYGWMSAPALAPELVLTGAEGVAALLARKGLPKAYQALNFLNREPYVRVGDNWATRIGRRAHRELEERLAQKPNWEYEPPIVGKSGKKLKPDVGTPQRNPLDPDERYLLELKPNTPTGRRAAERAVKVTAHEPWMDGAATIAAPASHQDQVARPPPHTEVIAASDFTPYGALAYTNQPAISIQLHPEFEPSYAQALVESRRGSRFTDEQANAAVESLRRPDDRARVGEWIRRFLAQAR